MPSVLPGCTTQCHTAMGDRCKCACGGRYHGIAKGDCLLPETEAQAEYILEHGFFPGKQYEMFPDMKPLIGFWGKLRKWISQQLRN